MRSAKLMSELVCPNCGHSIFLPLTKEGTYKCVNCQEDIEYKGEKKSFLSATDNELAKMLVKLSYDLADNGLKSNTVKKLVIGTATTVGLANVTAIGAFGFLLASVPGVLKEITENKLFAEKTVQKQFEELFNKHLKKALHEGKKPDKLKYYQFRLYFERFGQLSSLIMNKLIEENKNVDFFDKETIRYIYKNFYTDNPTDDELNNIIEVAGEIKNKYKKDITKDTKLREAYEELERLKEEKAILDYLKRNADWIETELKENSAKLKECIDRIKELPIKADNTAYIRTYSKPLFFEEKDSRLTLGSIYIDPSVEGSDKKASEIIKNWYSNDDTPSAMLILGSAGIGKSSLCSKIIADAAGKDIVADADRLFDIPPEKVHIKALRGCVSLLKDFEYGTIKELIERIFAPSDLEIEYDNDLFILDGLDELDVLCPKFDVDKLFQKLRELETDDYKILITPRESNNYGISIRDKRLAVEKLIWNEDDMNSWCTKYSNFKDLNAFYWCERFRDFYDKLDDEDDRKEVFLIPVILYIAAHTNIDFSSDSSVCKIYDKAFRSLLERDHIKGSGGKEAFSGSADNIRRKVYWQYTKELAYQMTIIGDLTLSDTEENSYSGIFEAQNMTRKMLDYDNPDNGDKIDFSIDNTEYMSVFQFAKSDDCGQSIEFVHKTVYEYFTAVKLFEDYFQKLTLESDFDQIWSTILQVFDKGCIEDNTIKHLAEMMKDPEKMDPDVVELFLSSFLPGLGRYLPFSFSVPYDLYKSDIQNQFSKLIKLLSLMGYKNEGYTEGFRGPFPRDPNDAFAFCFKTLLYVYKDSYYDLSSWHFEGINLNGMDMSNIRFSFAHFKYAKLNGIIINNEDMFILHHELNAGFYGAHMSHCKLSGIYSRYADFEKATLDNAKIKGSNLYCSIFIETDLRNADLSGSDLSGARFFKADLRDADLCGVRLCGTDFKEADLRGADLRGLIFDHADLQFFKGARYNDDPTKNRLITMFPEGFDPKAVGMILDNSPYSTEDH